MSNAIVSRAFLLSTRIMIVGPAPDWSAAISRTPSMLLRCFSYVLMTSSTPGPLSCSRWTAAKIVRPTRIRREFITRLLEKTDRVVLLQYNIPPFWNSLHRARQYRDIVKSRGPPTANALHWNSILLLKGKAAGLPARLRFA